MEKYALAATNDGDGVSYWVAADYEQEPAKNIARALSRVLSSSVHQDNGNKTDSMAEGNRQLVERSKIRSRLYYYYYKNNDRRNCISTTNRNILWGGVRVSSVCQKQISKPPRIDRKQRMKEVSN
mmetsp:Transcript_20313/g.49808  ORF Transcript_20313/g.49808 Transcript_20313/m.49808 type:complete len:125 (-) Transcript_20313:535-909(-)